MTVTIDGTQGVTTPKVTVVGTGAINNILPATTPGTFNYTLPAGNGTLVLSAVNLTMPGTIGTAGQVLTSDGSGGTTWSAGGGSSTLTIGSTAIGSGTTGSILINTAGVLQQLVMGAGVSGALAAAAGSANGFATLNGSGILPAAQGGIGGPLNAGWTSILGAAPGTGVGAALAANTNSANGLPTLNGSGALAVAQGGTGLTALGTAGQVLTVNPGATAAIWSTPASTGLAVGTTAVGGGAVGSLLIETTGNVLGEILMGAGVSTALAAAPGTAGGFALFDGALGTPTSGVLTNATGLPLSTGVTGTLSIANGGTGAATQVAALNNLLPAQGTHAGEFLTTDGSGTVTWATVSASAAGAATQVQINTGGALDADANFTYNSAGQVTLGVAGTQAGSLVLSGATSGTATIGVQPVAGSAVFNFPATTGASTQVLKTDGSGNADWVDGKVTVGTTDIALGTTALTIGGLTTLTLTQDPVNAFEASTKGYVDAATAAVNRIAPVDAATTANISLSGLQTIDTVSVTAGQRVLVKDQSLPAENGVYVAAAGPWSRSSDANTWNELVAAIVYINGGGQAGTSWIQTAPTPGTIDVTANNWAIQSSPLNYLAGTGISITLGTTINNSGVLSVSGGTTGLSFTSATGNATLQGILSASNGGTGQNSLGAGVSVALATATGTTGGLYLVGGSLGTPSALDLTNATNLPISTGLTGAGTGVLAALGNNTGTAGSFVVNGGGLGTPSSGVLTNATGLPLSTGVTGTLPVANGGTGATTLTGLIKGNGTSPMTAAVAGTDYVAPGGALGTPSSVVLTNATGLPLTGGAGVTGTLPIANGGTGLNSLGTAGQVLTVNPGATAAIWQTPSGGAASLTVGSSAIASGTTGSILINTANVLQEITMGSGVASALANAANGANGLMVANASGVLATSDGGTGLSSIGTAGQVLTVNPGATALVWTTPAAGGGLTVGSTSIGSGTTGSLLIDTSGVLQEIVMGAGVAGALAANAGSANGFALLNGSGVLPVAQGGVGGALNSGWTTILGAAPGTGVGSALAANTNSANGISVLNGSGFVEIAQGGTGAGTQNAALNNLLPSQSLQSGKVLTTDGTNVSWAAASGGLTVGTTAIGSGTTGSLLVDTSGVLQEITMGAGVSSALGNAANSANGLMVANASGVLATAQGGTGLSSIGTAGQVLTVNSGATGLTWTSLPMPVSNAPSAPSGTSTSVVIDSGVTANQQTFYYYWTAASAGGSQMVFEVSVNGGANWSTLQSSINGNPSAGSSRRGMIMLDKNNNQIRCTFEYVDTGGQGQSSGSTGGSGVWGSGTFRVRLRSTSANNVAYGAVYLAIPT